MQLINNAAQWTNTGELRPSPIASYRKKKCNPTGYFTIFPLKIQSKEIFFGACGFFFLEIREILVEEKAWKSNILNGSGEGGQIICGIAQSKIFHPMYSVNDIVYMKHLKELSLVFRKCYIVWHSISIKVLLLQQHLKRCCCSKRLFTVELGLKQLWWNFFCFVLFVCCVCLCFVLFLYCFSAK